MDYEKVWSVNDFVKNRSNWSLSADSELLKHLQNLSKNIIDKSRSTLELLESFESDVDRTCLSVANIGNRFKSLSDTQFIENKIQESPEIEGMIFEETKETRDKGIENVSTKLKEALDNGLAVLSSHYDIITVSDSDSENEEPQEILLKSCNPFIKRRLPYIIGSNDFTKYDHLGLADSSSEDEEEDEMADEVLEEEEPRDRIDVLPKKNIANIASTQIIQISSSDSEDSITSAGMNSRRDSAKDTIPNATNSFERNLEQSLPKTAHSFADHLNAALRDADVKRPTVLADCGRNDSFSPPPFPVKSNSALSSDEEKSDSGDSVSSRSSVNSRSSPGFFSSPSNTARSKDSNNKTNDGITDELLSNESMISKSVEDENARNSSSMFSVGPNSGLSSDLIHNEEKKLSRALADEFKSKILTKNNSVLPNRSSIEENLPDSKLPSKSLPSGSTSADVNVEKVSTTLGPRHYPREEDKIGININKRDEEVDRNLSSNEKPHQSTVSTVAPESAKRSWLSNIADDDDDEDDDSDEWFNRAISSKSQGTGTVSADVFKSSKLPSSQNLDKSSVKGDLPTESKTSIDCTSSIKENSVCPAQPKKSATEVEKVEKKYSLFGSEGADDSDDDDYLFTKKATIVSDKNKTNELYASLFNDSDTDDPIQALVEENKRKVGVNKLAESKIFDNSKIMNKPAKDSEIFDENYSISGSRASKTGENVLPEKILSQAEAKNSCSNDFPISDAETRLKKDEIGRIFQTVAQIPGLDVNFEKEKISTDNLKFESSENAPESKSCPIERKTLSSSVTTTKSLKSELDFSQSDSDESSMKTVDKKQVQFENISSGSANLVTCEENDKVQQQPCSQRDTNYLSEPSILGFDSKNDPAKTSTGLGNQILPDDAVISKSSDQINDQLDTSSLTQSSFDFGFDGFSPNAKIGSEVAVSPSSKNGSIISETITGISADDKTSLKEESSKEQTFTKEEIPSTLKTTKPGKLAADRGVNVNINALLPSSKWSKPKIKTITTGEMTSNENEDDNSMSISAAIHSNLSNVTKNRTKIQSKRRPPTRRGRKAHLDAQSFSETSVADASEPVSNDLEEIIQGSNSDASCDQSADKWAHVEPTRHVNSSAKVVPVNATLEDTLNNESRVGTSDSKFKDMDSIFDTIFCDDSGKDMISNPPLGAVSPSSPFDSSNQKPILGKSGLPQNPSSLEKKLDLSSSGDSRNDSTSSLIKDNKKIESSDLWEIADSPPKSSLLSKALDKDGSLVANVSKNDENLKSANKSRKTDLIGASVSSVKSDLFGDDDDEDFGKLFSSQKKPIKNLPSKKSSLFADDDEDDEQLFGVKTPKLNK